VYWDVRKTSGRRPDAGQRQRGPATRHSALVVERVGDSDVAVPADAAEMQQRRRREENVIGVEYVAGQRPEQPLTGYHLQQQRNERQPFKHTANRRLNDFSLPTPLQDCLLRSYVNMTSQKYFSYGRPNEGLYVLRLCFSLASLYASSLRSPHQEYDMLGRRLNLKTLFSDWTDPSPKL